MTPTSSTKSTATERNGWFFDVYAIGTGLVAWFIEELGDGEAGARLRTTSSFRPVIHLEGREQDVAACVADLVKAHHAEPVGWTKRMDVWTGMQVPVFALRLLALQKWHSLLPGHAQNHPLVTWHDAGLSPEQHWCMAHQMSPLLKCKFTVDEEDHLLSVTLDEDPWAVEYRVPPMETVRLSAKGSLSSSKGGWLRLVSVTMEHDGRETTWDGEEEILYGLQSAIDRIDPDIIVTNSGDAFTIPLLMETARRAGFPLRLDREEHPPRVRPRVSQDNQKAGGRSFFTYGRMSYSDPDCPLYGRYHLDASNSFMIGHTDLDGFFQSARICQMPMQRLARRSIGTGLTSIQCSMALSKKALVPWKKSQVEEWKTGEQLLKADRGGLVYAPSIGMHENVVELDFMSMFATIMVHHVSPETVACTCCDNKRVPGLGYSICEKREGFVSQALKPIVDLRMALSHAATEAKRTGDAKKLAAIKQRRDALKWFLVCSFGYLGYRNATFGRSEAHESVCAYAREFLVLAKERAEAAGWRMLHANVDSLWLERKEFTREDIKKLCEEIQAATDLPIALEGIYRWIAFLPSRRVPDRPVPTRFFGEFRDDTLKYRGIECRRHDIPVFIRDAQKRWLDRLTAAKDHAAYTTIALGLLPDIEELEGILWRGEAPLSELVWRTTLSQKPEEYRGDSPQAWAARQALSARLDFHPGQALEFIVVASKNPDKERRVCLACLTDASTSYDAAEYVRHLRRAANTLLWPANIQLDERRPQPPWVPQKSRIRSVTQPEQLELELEAL